MTGQQKLIMVKECNERSNVVHDEGEVMDWQEGKVQYEGVDDTGGEYELGGVWFFFSVRYTRSDLE